MKSAPRLNYGARATVEHMPFVGHRTCAEWGASKQSGARQFGRDMSPAERKKDAQEGSAMLLDALRKAAG